MKTPLTRLRIGGTVLASVFLLAVIVYHTAGGYDLAESIWLVVVTISTVGYSEHSSQTAAMQLFTVGLILVGISAAAYTFGGMVQLILEGELERALGRRRMTRDLKQLNDHVIICAFGRMGRNLADDLRIAGQPVLVIELQQEQVDEARAAGHLVLHGDATEEAVLTNGGLERARSIVSALPTNAQNVFITLTARNLNPQIQIVSRAEHQSTEMKLRQAGADRVVMPAVIGARQMVRMITRPSTADLIELVSESTFQDLELDEVAITPASPLVGKTVQETDARQRHRLLLVAIKQADGEMRFNPAADYQLQAGDIAILMGHSRDIRAFLAEL